MPIIDEDIKNDDTENDDTENDDIKKAWRYHNAYDNLIHARLQAFIASQAILLVPFVLAAKEPLEFSIFSIVLAVKEPQETNTFFIQLVIALVGIAMCIIAIWLMYPIANKLEFLKRDYLSKDEIYLKFLFNADAKWENKGELFNKRKKLKNSMIIPLAAPVVFLLMWGALISNYYYEIYFS